MNDAELKRYAKGAVARRPCRMEHLGISYEDASRRAQAICAAAGETGQTINAAAHLAELVPVLTTMRLEAA